MRLHRYIHSVSLSVLLLLPSCAAPACWPFGPAIVVGTPQDPALTEISGAVASRKHPGVLWVHNDSGDSARVFAMKEDGAALGQYALENANAVDWEDIALGPGPVAGTDYLYLGDIGDNNRVRSSIQVYRVPEPEVNVDQAPVTTTVSGTETMVLHYPDAPTVVYDCETLMIDPITGDLYLVTKQTSSETSVQVYVVPAPLMAGDYTLTPVGSMTFPAGLGYRVTGGDISPDGTEVVLRRYNAVLYWKVTDELHLYDIFAEPPCIADAQLDPQGESIAFRPDGGGFFTMSENLGDLGPFPIHFYPRIKYLAADEDRDQKIDLSELLRLVQLYHAGTFHCEDGTEDGFATGPGDTSCTPHNSDYAPQDWSIKFSELSRAIQIYNVGGYAACPDSATEDGFCPQL